VQLKFAEGLQEKFPVPAAVSVVEFPEQTETSAPALTAGFGKVETETEAVSAHPLIFTTSVYVVFEVGLATGLEIFGLVKLEEGLQLYVPPPLPFKVVPDPGQTVTFGPAFALGFGLTVRVTNAVSEQPEPLVTANVYAADEPGFAMGFPQVVQLSPVEGLQLYVAPAGPVGFPPSVAEFPMQMV
jgi:hypothetical protein